MLEAFLKDIQTVIAVLLIFAVVFAMVMATVVELFYKAGGNKAKIAVDKMYEECKSDSVDELQTWYKIRNHISGNQNLTPRYRREMIEVVQARITGCKIRKRASKLKGSYSGSTLIINN